MGKQYSIQFYSLCILNTENILSKLLFALSNLISSVLIERSFYYVNSECCAAINWIAYLNCLFESLCVFIKQVTLSDSDMFWILCNKKNCSKQFAIDKAVMFTLMLHRYAWRMNHKPLLNGIKYKVDSEMLHCDQVIAKYRINNIDKDACVLWSHFVWCETSKRT